MVAEDVTIGPGATQTFTADGPVTGTVTNTVTAAGVLDDPDATAVSETASAVTSPARTAPSRSPRPPPPSDVCDGASVTYTYHGHQRQRQLQLDRRPWSTASWARSPSDVTIGPGETVTYTPAGVITGTVTNTVTADGAFGDPDAPRRPPTTPGDRHQPRLRHQVTKLPADERRVQRRARSTTPTRSPTTATSSTGPAP